MRTLSISRLLPSLSILLLAACTASEPPQPRESGVGFDDPFGRRPVSVVHHVGRSVRLDYRVPELPRLSPVERNRQARAIAEVALREFAGEGGLDTVLITFSHGDTTRGWRSETSRTQSQSFPFLRPEMQGWR